MSSPVIEFAVLIKIENDEILFSYNSEKILKLYLLVRVLVSLITGISKL